MAISNEVGVDDVQSQSGTESEENRTEVRIATSQKHAQLYDKTLPTAYQWSQVRPAFVRGILDEVGLNHRFAAGRTLDHEGVDAEETGSLIVYPDETRVFVGRDDTAHTRGDYGFAIRPNDPVPMPGTVEDALDLLKPLGVRSQMEELGELPQRQGEWWLLETDETPEGSIFQGGVSERPFNVSPLENHVPTEYGFGVKDEVLHDWFESEYPSIVQDSDSLPDIFSRIEEVIEIDEFEDVEAQFGYPDFQEVREAAGGVFVKGTLRHRENDHFMEKIGDEWRLARTHDMTVYTADSTSARVRMD